MKDQPLQRPSHPFNILWPTGDDHRTNECQVSLSFTGSEVQQRAKSTIRELRNSNRNCHLNHLIQLRTAVEEDRITTAAMTACNRRSVRTCRAHHPATPHIILTRAHQCQQEAVAIHQVQEAHTITTRHHLTAMRQLGICLRCLLTASELHHYQVYPSHHHRARRAQASTRSDAETSRAKAFAL